MKLISFQYKSGALQAGIIVNGYAYALKDLHPSLSDAMSEVLNDWDRQMNYLRVALKKMEEGRMRFTPGYQLESIILHAPLPAPRSLRDGYAFRQHVVTARRNRGLEMTKAFDEYPVFYFGNHQSVTGPGIVQCMPDHFEQLDFELECAIVICGEGSNIPAEKADDYIGGLMVLNDFSARTLQMEEMQLSLGPAKGKDFATTIGPWLVTTDELTDREIAGKRKHTGKRWNLPMRAYINNRLVSKGNLSDMDWTFAELIERASYGVTLYPGDIIGSGTVGTGCLLELNGTAKRRNPEFVPEWLRPGDTVELEIEGLGRLSNTVLRTESSHSILEKKKSHYLI